MLVDQYELQICMIINTFAQINHHQTNKIMKKLIFLLAVAGMFAFSACNNGTKTGSSSTDSTVVTKTTTTVDSTITKTPADTTKK